VELNIGYAKLSSSQSRFMAAATCSGLPAKGFDLWSAQPESDVAGTAGRRSRSSTAMHERQFVFSSEYSIMKTREQV
jgi:hypothetical protein